jgi:hypothetical protein
MERGFGGRIYLNPVFRPEVIKFYQNRGGTFINGAFYWDEAAAQALLKP